MSTRLCKISPFLPPVMHSTLKLENTVLYHKTKSHSKVWEKVFLNEDSSWKTNKTIAWQKRSTYSGIHRAFWRRDSHRGNGSLYLGSAVFSLRKNRMSSLGLYKSQLNKRLLTLIQDTLKMPVSFFVSHDVFLAMHIWFQESWGDLGYLPKLTLLLRLVEKTGAKWAEADDRTHSWQPLWTRPGG